MKHRSVLLTALGASFILGAAAPAFADPGWGHYRDGPRWHEWREHERWEHRRWRHRHPRFVYAPPPVYYAAPPVYYGWGR